MQDVCDAPSLWIKGVRRRVSLAGGYRLGVVVGEEKKRESFL